MCSSVLLAQSYGDTEIDFQKSRLLLSRATPMRIGLLLHRVPDHGVTILLGSSCPSACFGSLRNFLKTLGRLLKLGLVKLGRLLKFVNLVGCFVVA